MDDSQDPAAAAGKLLHNARWMTGLTQAEVAQRAGISQQTVALYERGARQPSVVTLSKLVAGCGLRLSWQLVPEPGLEDQPTLELLARDPMDRLDPKLSSALADLLEANDGLTLMIGGKTGARLHGANLSVDEIEFWVDPAVDLDQLNAYLARAVIRYIPPLSNTAEEAIADRERLRSGYPLSSHHALVHLRGAEHYAGLLDRSVAIPVEGRGFSVLVASPYDCARYWHDRDLDHLALQRAVRLATTFGQRQPTSQPG